MSNDSTIKQTVYSQKVALLSNCIASFQDIRGSLNGKQYSESSLEDLWVKLREVVNDKYKELKKNKDGKYIKNEVKAASNSQQKKVSKQNGEEQTKESEKQEDEQRETCKKLIESEIVDIHNPEDINVVSSSEKPNSNSSKKSAENTGQSSPIKISELSVSKTSTIPKLQENAFYNWDQPIDLDRIFKACVDNSIQIYKREYKFANPLKTVETVAQLRALFNPRLLSIAAKVLRINPVLPWEHECEVLDVKQFNLDIRVGKIFGPFVSRNGHQVSLGQIRNCRMHGWNIFADRSLFELKVYYNNRETGYVLAVTERQVEILLMPQEIVVQRMFVDSLGNLIL